MEERAVKYLVIEKDGKKHLPYTDADGKPNHNLMGSAWAALHGGYRGEKYQGPDKEGAISKLKSVYKSEGMKTPDEKDSIGDAFEVRSFRAMTEPGSEGKQPTLTGMPIMFNSLSQDLGGFCERIDPEACEFDDDLKADFNHDPNFILGRQSNGTLKMRKTADGYQMVVDPPDTQWARDLMTSVKRGDINEGSFAFRVKPGGQKWTEEGGQQVRVLTGIRVRRVSLVSDPAYLQTKGFQVRSITDILADKPELPAVDDPPAGLAAPPAPVPAEDFSIRRRRLDLIAAEI